MPINKFNFSEQILELISTDTAAAGSYATPLFSTVVGSTDFIRLTVFDTNNNIMNDKIRARAIYAG